MKKIFLGLILLVSSTTFSQMDSIEFSMSFVTNPTFTAGLDSTSKNGDVFQVRIPIADLDSIGQLTLMIYDITNSSLVANILLNKEQIMNGTYIQSGFLILNFPYLIPTATYRVILDRQNTQQAYLSRIEKTFPTN